MQLSPGSDISGHRRALGSVIDADVHVMVPFIEALFPYLEPRWQEFIRGADFRGPEGYDWSYPAGAPTTVRPDALPPDEGRSVTKEVFGGTLSVSPSLEVVSERALGPWQTELAILNCYYGVDMLRHPDFGAALASAVNDWLIEEWLDKDPRLRASIVIGPHDIPAAVREVDRVGAHDGFVQVLLPARSERPYGNRYWWPLLEAIRRNDLVAGVHFGGMQGNPPTPTGWPTFYLEEFAGMATVFQSQITSLVVEGVFEKFAGLRVALVEGGFTWIPSLLWRLDKEWKGFRRETPWVKQAPSTTIRENMRATTQPLDLPYERRHVEEILEWLGADDFLMFSTDYPHQHDGNVDELLDVLGPAERQAVMSENARSFYRL
jgi:uncharacterized protein